MNGGPVRYLTAVAAKPGHPADVVSAVRRESPTRPAGHVRLGMLAAAINPSDLVTIRGTYSRTTFPFRPGFEGVGEVAAADRGSRFRPGDRVIGIRCAGAWSSIRDVPEEDCIRVPADLPVEQAATAYINPLTALAALDLLDGFPDAAPGRAAPVVVTAASSTIADHLAALLAHRGMPAVAVVRSIRSRLRRPELWDAVVRTDDPHWVRRLADAADGAAVVLDAVGGTVAARAAAALGGGPGRSSATPVRLISYGLMSGEPIATALLPPDARITHLHLRTLIHDGGPDLVAGLFARAFALLRSGEFHTDIARTFPLADVREALAWNASHPGKVLLMPPGVPGI